jgi:phage tail sheath protein FI
VSFDAGATKSTADLGKGPVASLQDAASRLEAGIRNAQPGVPAWAQATVRAAGGRLQVVAGATAPEAIIKILVSGGDAVTADALGFVTNQTENVAQYQLGAKASAGQGAGTAGMDGAPPVMAALIGSNATNPPTGMHALDKVSLFNILCLPRIARVSDTTTNFPQNEVDSAISAATNYCERRRAFLIVDTPSDIDGVPAIKAWLEQHATLRHKNLAINFPRVMIADPLSDFQSRSFGASGTAAGLYARTDVERGVWKAPAGTEAVLRNVQQLSYKLTDQENGTLNPLGINCLRSFPVYGNVAWGARTLDGSDQQASEWKYVPVRRLALFLEESLYRGTQWVVFEPNDEPLWAQIRLNIGAFMHNLFRQGAFQGQTPKEAYLVKCDKETTTQNDINLGIVNIVVGFAPLKPAEFVIIKIQQLAGQIQT